ncbi:MAG TPA: hypothetical protein PKO06_11470, partial [Candidatus Ozemobacteraceae bacterium]|nr:hypothetical protein [Candidatus Ozemobacteraceae bacterium]
MSDGCRTRPAAVVKFAGVLLALLLVTVVLAAGPRVDYQWVETNLALTANGHAIVTTKVRIAVLEGSMGGWDYQGVAGDPVFATEHCLVLFADRSSHPVTVKPQANRLWAIDIADGTRIPAGTAATFVLTFTVNLLGSGHLGLSRAEKTGQEVIYLNWADPAFDEPLEHRTVYVHFPHEVSDPTAVNPDEWRRTILTEPFMNEYYRIDYRAQRTDAGKLFLTQVLHRESVGTRESMRVQQYLPRAAFPGFRLPESSPSTPQPQGVIEGAPPSSDIGESESETHRRRRELAESDPERSFSTSPWRARFAAGGTVLFITYLALFSLYVKRRRQLADLPKLRELSWEGENWEPPRIQVASFRKNGKVADLAILEAMLLLELPPIKLIACMVAQLEREGIVRVFAAKPLRLEILEKSRTGDPYEQLLLDAVDADGAV